MISQNLYTNKRGENMFKVIETAGQDEPWWFSMTGKNDYFSTEEFSSLEEAKNSFQQHEARLAANYPENDQKEQAPLLFGMRRTRLLCGV